MRKADSWIQDKSDDLGEESIELLETFGVSAAKSMVTQDADQAAKYAQKIGFPVVMKVVSPDALHKSEAGGVVLNVRDVNQVRRSYKELRDNLFAYKRDARFKGVRIGQMASTGCDMFIGAKHDTSFGPVVFFGMGGVFIEILKDVATVLCPTTPQEVMKKLERLKSFTLLKGYRGQDPYDIDAFVDCVVRVSHLMNRFARMMNSMSIRSEFFPETKVSLHLMHE
ncbi:MAG: acetate--CoA ligase family protein [Desulfomicrobium escambiense]|nr:acetate--CoA ligase family protein [Desulfomicrobium escambiense]